MEDIIYAIKTVDNGLFEDKKSRLLKFIPQGQKPWMENFSKSGDRQRSLLGECLSRWALSSSTGISPGELIIRRTAQGKPLLDSKSIPRFNLSHSGEWIVVALSVQNVGVDVERIRTPEYRVANRYFSMEEVRQLNVLNGKEKDSYFFDLWTLKESYLKLLGKGLTQSLGSFTIVREENTFRLKKNGKIDKSINFKMPFLDPSYKLAVCSLSPGFGLKIKKVTIEELIQSDIHAGRT